MKQHEEGNKFDLMKYRLESAKSDLKSAKILIEAEEYRAANIYAFLIQFSDPIEKKTNRKIILAFNPRTWEAEIGRFL